MGALAGWNPAPKIINEILKKEMENAKDRKAVLCNETKNEHL